MNGGFIHSDGKGRFPVSRPKESTTMIALF